MLLVIVNPNLVNLVLPAIPFISTPDPGQSVHNPYILKWPLHFYPISFYDRVRQMVKWFM